jgi:O-antigen ligase
MEGHWQGAFSHKNVLGHVMAILFATSAILLLHGWRPVVSAGGLVVAAGLLVLSRSGAAVVALALALAPLPVVFLFRRGAIPSALATGLVVAVAATSLLTSELMQIDLIDLTLDTLGKDSTLTGRTILWGFGMEAFQSRPWLGFGFKGYWSSPDTSAYLLHIAVGQELWFFHNNFIEVAVAFGVVGAVLFVTGLGIAVFVATKKALVTDSFLTFWPLFMIVYIIVLALAENPLFENHSFHQLLFVTAVGSQLKNGIGRT